jgi:vesicle-associated membrane protein 7
MIVYAVICRAKDAAILVEYFTESLSGNAPQVTTALLEHLRDNPNVIQEGNLKTFVHRNSDETVSEDFFSTVIQACTVPINSAEDLDLGSFEEHYFHLWYQDGVYYCCLSDSPEPRHHKVAFAFLQAVARDFSGKYFSLKIMNCNAYAMNKDFSPNIRSAMHYYNINCDTLSRDQKINSLMTQVEDMKTLLGRNLQLMLDRGEKMDRLLATSDRALKDSEVFRRRSEKVKQLKRFRMIKTYMVLGGMMLLIGIIVGSVAARK